MSSSIIYIIFYEMCKNLSSAGNGMLNIVATEEQYKYIGYTHISN